MNNAFLFVAVLTLPALFSAPAIAQEQTAPEGWRVAAGAGLVSGPRSLGADRQHTFAVPSLDIQYQDWFFANPVNGVGVNAKAGGIDLSAAIAPDFNERDPKAGGRSANLAKVAMAPALRLKASYEVAGWATEAVLSSRIGRANRNGTTMALEEGTDVYGSQRLQVSAGLVARLMDSTYARNFVSVSSIDSAHSGLPRYEARAGLLDAGPFLQLVYSFDEHWTAFSKLEVRTLLGDAWKSPVVERRTAPSLLLFVNYTL